MAVDCAGLGREQGDLAGDLRLQRLRFRGIEPAHRAYARSLGARRDRLQRRSLAGMGADDQLAAGFVRQAALA